MSRNGPHFLAASLFPPELPGVDVLSHRWGEGGVAFVPRAICIPRHEPMLSLIKYLLGAKAIALYMCFMPKSTYLPVRIFPPPYR